MGGVLARQLGIAIQLIAVEPKAQLTGDALTACQRALEAGLELEDASSAIRYPVIVDALLGTELKACHGRSWLRPSSRLMVWRIYVELDLPSGLNANTGEAQLAVRADATVSFIARKIGLYTGQGPAHSGQRLFSNPWCGRRFRRLMAACLCVVGMQACIRLCRWRPTNISGVM